MPIESSTRKQEILEEIVSAREAGIQLYICTLIHNYSLIRRDRSGRQFYVGNPVWEEGKNLGGKRIVGESELTRRIFPHTILIEGQTPDWRYDPEYPKKVRHDFLAAQDRRSSPNLHEFIKDADELDINVRGCDIPYEGRDEIKKRVGYTRHGTDGQDFVEFFEFLRQQRSVSTADIARIDSFLADSRPRKDLDDPNYYYNYCNYLDYFLSRISRNLKDQLVEHIVHFSDAKRALREYIQERDSLIPQTLSEEMTNGKTVLLKIGNAHIDDKYAFLPGYLEKEGIPYHHFFNWQAHTETEIEEWEEIKERKEQRELEEKRLI